MYHDYLMYHKLKLSNAYLLTDVADEFTTDECLFTYNVCTKSPYNCTSLKTVPKKEYEI